MGNMRSETSSINGINYGNWTYTADDELSTERYDADGNAWNSGGNYFAYDSDNELKSMNRGAVTLLYDGDGNRVAKTVNGVTTRYLVDDLNPTGLPQVVEETVNNVVQRQYTYGLQLISENQVVGNTWTVSFYGVDGAGSVRQLTNSAGVVTDTYEYDAFGNKVSSTGTTPNNYLYRGEQYDPDLSLYYLRARYYNPVTGRFLSADPEAGEGQRRYEYAGADPVNGMDPTGNEDMIEWALLIHYPSRMSWISVHFPGWCGIAGGDFLGECNAPGPGAPSPPSPPPCCFARLKYRAVYAKIPYLGIPEFVGEHSFWFVQDRTGLQHVIDGGPSGPNGTGNLVDWDTPGTVSRQYPQDNSSAWTWWDSGTGSGFLCTQVDRLINAADTWPPYRLPPYSGPFGPNSNSFAHAVGVAASFNPSKPTDAVAWDYPIPY